MDLQIREYNQVYKQNSKIFKALNLVISDIKKYHRTIDRQFAYISLINNQ
jgi:hypothetical protein